jgi:hypothetical protein
VNVDVIKSADVVPLTGAFHHHPAGGYAAPALLEFGNMSPNGILDVLRRI